MTTATIDENKLNEFMGKAVGDVGAAISAALVVIGDKLGLYKAMAAAGPLTPAELAKRTETTERYVREWLNARRRAATSPTTPRPAATRCRPSRRSRWPTRRARRSCPGAFQVIAAAMRAEPRDRAGASAPAAASTGASSDPCLFEGTERFFRSGYIGNLVSAWIPALDGVEAKLERGARVADVGCGHGASTILMAQAFPNSTFVGFDYHAASIETARAAGARRGRGRPRALRGRGRDRLRRQRLRPGRVLRLPARHGRPGRRGAARPEGARPRTAPG